MTNWSGPGWVSETPHVSITYPAAGGLTMLRSPLDRWQSSVRPISKIRPGAMSNMAAGGRFSCWASPAANHLGVGVHKSVGSWYLGAEWSEA